MKTKILLLIITGVLFLSGYKGNSQYQIHKKVITAAEQLDSYLPLLQEKRVGIMCNQTTMVGNKHLVDVLLEEKVDIQYILAPEHGFRGKIERGENVYNEVDPKTSLPIYQLYKVNEKADSIVNAVDILIFDIREQEGDFGNRTANS